MPISEDLKVRQAAWDMIKCIDEYIDVQRLRTRNPTITEEVHNHLFDEAAKRYAASRLELKELLNRTF